MDYLSLLIALSIALCAFLLAYVAGNWIWNVRDIARYRGEALATESDSRESVANWAWKRLSQLGERLLPILGDERIRISETLYIAGYRRSTAPAVFVTVKAGLVLTSVICIWLLWRSPTTLTSPQLMLISALIVALALLLPNWWLREKLKRRQMRLRNAFPDALDMLVICVEAGLGLSAAMERVTDEIRHMHPDLATEFAAVNAEIRSGVERGTALRSLNVRTGLLEIRGFVSLLTQTLQLGTGVGNSLRIYAEDFRDQRMQRAENQAAKIGTKMIFPLVFCEFPAFFLIAIGPAILRILDSFGA